MFLYCCKVFAILNTLRVKPVLVKDNKTGSITEYSSAKECADALGMLATTLNYRLKHRGQKMFDDGTQVKYKDEVLSFSNIDTRILSIIQIAPSI